VSSYEDITVVAIHGNGGILKMVPSVERTARGMPGCRSLLITDTLVDTRHPQKRLAQKIDFLGYSEFVLFCLHHFIETDYALIVQADGWALNQANWDDKWFEYDYIGGLTHGALAEGTFFPWYKWVGKRDPLVVQNGGFSLRSKRLLEAPSRYGIVRHIKGDFALNNEDIQLCCYMRPALESVGMVFEPDEEAKRFALPDYLDPTIHGNLVLEKVYGHHSALRRLASENTVLWGIPDREVYGYDKILRLFEGYGYAISRTSLEELVKSR
jgi:hypothetical protein